MRTGKIFVTGFALLSILLVSGVAFGELDRFGGDTRLKSSINNVGVTFFGTVSSATANSITDSSANFPTDGRLVGKLINPNINRGDSGAPAYAEKWFRIVSNTQTTIYTDPADGDMTAIPYPPAPGTQYHITGVFALEKIGNRWWFIDPEGNAFFPRAVSKTNDDGYASFQKYDAVYIQRSGAFTGNLNLAAEDPYPADVVGEAGVTAQQVGDAIYIGSLKPFSVTYFYLNQKGSGGKIQWYYSSSDAAQWKLINGNGNPAAGAILNADGSYNLDIGNYLGPDENGFLGSWSNPNADKIDWWRLKWNYQGGDNTILPKDFATLSIPADGVPRYYIKGVVTAAFATAPIAAQIYDTPALGDIMQSKYAAPFTNPYVNWVQAINQRYRNWGFNAIGQYSSRYAVTDGASPLDRLPTEPTSQISGYAMDSRFTWNVKNVYEGAQCPPGGSLVWQGGTADVFEPKYKTAVESLAKESISSNPWHFILIPEEADWLFGINSVGHDHMGYIVLSQNPYKTSSMGVTVTDTRLYSKYALRDFLRYRYKDSADPLQPFTITTAVPAYIYSKSPVAGSAEHNALQRLNAAWGSSYATWDTSAPGDVNSASNAWGTGTGFMDENGKSVFPGYCGSIQYSTFSKPGYPAVKQDLDDFVVLFTQKYGSIIYPAVKSKTANLVALPLYNSPNFVSSAIRPYTDLIWASLDNITRAQEIYRFSGKSLFIADYMTAEHDSPLDFGGAITAISYDAGRDRTVIAFSGRPYKFRLPWFMEFPDSTVLNAYDGRCNYLWPKPRPVKINWMTVEIAGNYAKTGCIELGHRIRIAGGWDQRETQPARAQAMQQRIDSFVNTAGDDGSYFVVGWEHWSYQDHALMDGNENFNFGLVTALDNAYDGIEARRAVGKDVNGRWVGGEDGDYGVLVGPLSPLTLYLNGLYDKLILQPAPINDITAPVISNVAASTTTNFATITWSTNELSNSQVEYGLTSALGTFTPVDNSLVTSHSVALSGLQLNTLYYYRARSQDAAGNPSTSATLTFTTSSVSDTTPPFRSNGSPGGTLPAGTTQTVISLNTDENANCRYSLTSGAAYSSMTNNFAVTGGTSHSSTASGLSDGRTYAYYVRCSDAAGNANNDDFVISFSVANAPPAILNVAASSITPDSSVITWATDEPADSQVEYGTTMTYGSVTSLDTALVTSHSVQLSGLQPNTLYHYRVKSRDSAGALTVSADYTFTTASEAAPLVISNVSSTTTASSANIKWATNKPSTSQVEYGKTTAYGSSTPLDTALVTNHAITISGLASKTTYYYRVKSTDSSGNTAISGNFKFRTKPPGGKTTSSVTNLQASSGSVVLTWKNPDDPSFVSVVILRRTDTYAEGFDPIYKVAETREERWVDANAVPGVTYYYTIFVYDGADYSDPQFVSFTTTGPAAPALELNKYTANIGIVGTVLENIVRIEMTSIAAKEIGIKTSSTAQDAVLRVEKHDRKPPSVADISAAEVYQWLDITVESTSSVNYARIRFTVPKSWLEQNGFDRSNVILRRFMNGRWQRLLTRIISESLGEVEYEAVSSGLSIFAITAEQPGESLFTSVLEEIYRSAWLYGIIAIFVVGAYLHYRHPQKMSKDEERAKRLSKKIWKEKEKIYRKRAYSE